MELLKRNNSIWIDREALTTLEIVAEGILSPVAKLMSEKEAREVDETGKYQNSTFPFSFILAPNGKRNREVLLNAKEGEIIDLRVKGELIGTIKVDEIFKINKNKEWKKSLELIISHIRGSRKL